MEQYKDLSLVELKAMAYDAIAHKEYWHNRLMEINQVIAKMSQEAAKVENPVDEPKAELKPAKNK